MKLRLLTLLVVLATLLGSEAQEWHYRLWFSDKTLR